jgi:glycosyltransferase involved in cell wall biosynthesis
MIVAGTGEKRILNRFRDYAPLIRVLGWVSPSDIRALFGISDLTILPSTCHENSPVVIFESYQVGTPVIGSDFGGIPELIDQDVTGYLFPRGDSARLAEEIILHFSRSVVAQRKMRQACYRRVTTGLTLDKHIHGLLGIYKEVLKA